MLEAVESGIPEAVSAAVGSMRQELVVEELTAHRRDDEGRLETLIMLAASRGNMAMFNAVLGAMQRVLSEREVCYSPPPLNPK